MSRWENDAETEEEEEDLEGLELDPNDPTHPDYDLSDAAGYAEWEPSPKPVLLWRGVVLVVSLLIITGLFLSLLLRVLF